MFAHLNLFNKNFKNVKYIPMKNEQKNIIIITDSINDQINLINFIYLKFGRNSDSITL